MMIGLLSSINIHVPLSPILLFSLMALLLAIWLAFTMVIRYHWKSYGTKDLEVVSLNFFYLAGSGVIILLMCASLLFYYSS
jgi:uncharacterized membrane protein